MYTQCPQCLTIYRVAEGDLAAARGHGRCGHCDSVFDMLPTLTTQLPLESIEFLPEHAAQATPPTLGAPVLRPRSAHASAPTADPPMPRGARRGALPTFARSRRAPARGNRRWLAASAVLLLTLGAQIAWSQRANWIDDGRVRGVLEPLCARLHCQLPLRHDASALELLSRDIQPHPSVADALIISATLHNTAPYAQAWPTVEVALSDLDDKRIAMRRFQPRDYLADANTVAQGIAAGASSSLVFEVVDPGHNAVAFEFRFE